jgi:hypothetical protein
MKYYSSAGILHYEVSSSALMIYFYYRVAFDCTVAKNPDACQVLANLCVLNLYNEDNAVCKLYDKSVEKITTVY